MYLKCCYIASRMKYVVTGGAGFIGSHLVEALLKQDHEVIVIDDLSTGNIKNLSACRNRITFVKGSILDRSLLKDHMQGADGVFHQAAIASVPRSVANPMQTNEAGITGTLSVLLEARDAKVRRVVFASSSSVYGDDPSLPKREDVIGRVLSPYALTKKTGEEYMHLFHDLYGLETVSLRYFNVFGPRQNPKGEYAAVIPKFIECIMNDARPIIFGEGKHSRDFVFVDNVVQANMLAMNNKKAVNQVFNIGSGGQVTILEVAELITDFLGKDTKPEFLPARAGDPLHTKADISKARSLLGFDPKIDFKQGLRLTVKSFTG